jgi:cellulose synthase (UDP-forming)
MTEQTTHTPNTGTTRADLTSGRPMSQRPSSTRSPVEADTVSLCRGYSVADEAAVDLAITTAGRADDPTASVQPPTDSEKYQYVRRSRRWVLPVQSVLFLPVLLSLAKFALLSPWLVPFLAWVLLGFVNTLVGAYSSNQKRRVTYGGHRATVSGYAPAHWPSVDVFLPTAGEPLEVLVNTYRHVAALSYPGRVDVHVLDDGARGEVAAAADRFGFRYIVRPDRGHMKKAGNMLHALGMTGNDLILVLDADFVPRPDMLRELAPYFADDSVGIVQSPQYFDTTPEQNWLQRCAGATQELFYRWVQPSRDGLGVAICVGTSAVYRRAALLRAGGFAQIEHSEDVHTGVKLRKAGYGLRYVPVLLSKGLCPSEVKPFISQQYRWATGSMSLMKDRSFYREANVGIRRLLPYLSGFLYYITTGLAVFVSMLPGPIMMWFYPAQVAPENYLPFVGGPLVWFVILPLVSTGRWRVEVLRVQMLYSFAHFKALLDTLHNRTAGWVPTGAKKAPNPVATVVMRLIRLMIPFNLLALVSGVAHVALSYGLEQVWPAALYGVLYGYIAVPLLFAPKVLSWRDLLLPRRMPSRDLTSPVSLPAVLPAV